MDFLFLRIMPWGLRLISRDKKERREPTCCTAYTVIMRKRQVKYEVCILVVLIDVWMYYPVRLAQPSPVAPASGGVAGNTRTYCVWYPEYIQYYAPRWLTLDAINY